MKKLEAGGMENVVLTRQVPGDAAAATDAGIL
jgi:hypothetical protein